MSYNPSDKSAILAHARKLLGKSLRVLYPCIKGTFQGKGSMGQSVEKYHFHYLPNNTAAPDFPQAGVELKCTPLKEIGDGSMVSKERLVLNIIDYVTEGTKTFETSSFWTKNKLLLLMFYLHEDDPKKNILDFLFKIIRLWEFPEIDKKIIQDDWNVIHQKIVSGHAHELSEGDTFYLCACIKGSKGGANKRPQYNAFLPLADQRAYSLKSKYLNTIILDSLLHAEMCRGIVMSANERAKISQSIIHSRDDFRPDETFEGLIERKFNHFYGRTIYDIENELGTHFTDKVKALSNEVIHTILGVKTPKIREFENANIQQKSVRLEPSGGLKESMVFSQINYDEIVNEERWEEAVWYRTLTQRFLFIVFQKSSTKDNKLAVLKKVFFWTMPYQDLQKARDFWKDTRDKIRHHEFEHFISLADKQICHVRPKAKNAADCVETKAFGRQKKNGYWLNSSYILSIVKEHLV